MTTTTAKSAPVRVALRPIIRPEIPRTPLARLRWAIADTWTITQRDLTHWVREPGRILAGLLYPCVMVLLFGYVFGSSMTVEGGGDYRQFLMPGMFAMTMMMGIGETMSAINNDASKGVTDRFRSMPMAPSAVVSGRSVADIMNSALDLGFLLLCAMIVGWRSNGSVTETAAAIGLLLLLRLAALWVGIYIGLVVRSPETVASLYGLLFPLTMVSNTFASPSAMPDWLGFIAEWNPLSSTVTATRELFGNPMGGGGGSWIVDNAALMAVVWPVLLIAVFFPLSVRQYRRLSR
ncbi:ABC transporter permease [Streptomyces cyaneofuscatus]|uniref:ABC transporter permease n=1 Tax=Streptomyces cyaneofuscatus TaxID=66883 RepID=UPI0033A451AE